MSKYWRYIKNRRGTILTVLVLLVLGWFFLGRGEELPEETLTVAVGEFVQQVSVSGKVVAAQDVDLAFNETGRVASVPVEVGDRVVQGQLLASLATDVLYSQLSSARIDLQETTKEQNTLVESAYRTLLSNNLTAVPDSTYTVAAPTITGLYSGPEGVYKIRITEKENSTDSQLRVLGLEDTPLTIISDDEPTPVGTRGLFVSFPSDPGLYEDTTWTLNIPNTKGSSYVANRTAYEEALSTRTRAIASVQAEVSRIETEIGDKALRAPFAGIVTAVPAKVGGIASANEIAVLLQSDDTLQIESYIPEINISLVEVGDVAEITLDAYGAKVPFAATIISTDPAETIRDGVSTYRAILEFSADDERIKSGMTANVEITTDKREGVISIPQGAVIERSGKKFVEVKRGDDKEEREIEIGLVSSSGMVEVISGLNDGETIVLSQ